MSSQAAIPAPHPALNAPAERRVAVEDNQPLLRSENTNSEQESAPSSVSERAMSALRRAFTWRSPSAAASAEAAPPDLEQPADGVATIPIIAERSEGDASEGSSSGSGSREIEGAKPAPARAASANPVCLICLETLAPDDFGSGRAITLGCNCRGDLALRHRDCAIKWAQVKDDGRGGVPTCELCKHPVRNLPPLPARPRLPPHVEAAIVDDLYSGDHAATYADFVPSQADMVFDCVRVCWVGMIVAILFFEASLGAALWTGVIAGLAYSLLVRVMYRQHFAAMRAYSMEQAALRQPPPPPAPQQQQQQQPAAPPVVDAV